MSRSHRPLLALATLGLGLSAVTSAQAQQASHDVLGAFADHAAIFVDGKTFQIAAGSASEGTAAGVDKLNAREIGPGAIIFRDGDKLYIVDSTPESSRQMVKNFQDNWNVSYLKALKDFQDKWNVSYAKNFQDNWNVSYARTCQDGRDAVHAKDPKAEEHIAMMKNFQDNWNVSYLKALKDFQDNWNVSYVKNFQDNWNVSYAKNFQDNWNVSYARDLKNFQDNWATSYMQ